MQSTGCKNLDPDMQEVLLFWKQKCDLTILETNAWRLRHAGSFLKWTGEYFNDEKCFQQVLNSCTHLCIPVYSTCGEIALKV